MGRKAHFYYIISILVSALPVVVGFVTMTTSACTKLLSTVSLTFFCAWWCLEAYLSREWWGVIQPELYWALLIHLTKGVCLQTFHRPSSDLAAEALYCYACINMCKERKKEERTENIFLTENYFKHFHLKFCIKANILLGKWFKLCAFLCRCLNDSPQISERDQIWNMKKN